MADLVSKAVPREHRAPKPGAAEGATPPGNAQAKWTDGRRRALESGYAVEANGE